MSKKDIISVKDLIESLQSMPADLPVLVDGYETGYESMHVPEIMKLKRKSNNPYYDGEFQVVEGEDKNFIEAVVLQRVVRDV